MKKWQCTVCGYIHEGEEPPEKCPVCGADRDRFVEFKDSDEIGDKQLQQESIDSLFPNDPPQRAATLFDKVSKLVVEKHLHPISVHSPNGIIPAAVVFVLLGILTQSASLADAAYFSMVFVLLAMPVVLFSGYITWQKKYSGAKTTLFKIKISCSCVATVILLGLVIWRTIEPTVLSTASLDRWLFLFWSLALLVLVGIAGHLGGQLVFGGTNGVSVKKK